MVISLDIDQQIQRCTIYDDNNKKTCALVSVYERSRDRRKNNTNVKIISWVFGITSIVGSFGYLFGGNKVAVCDMVDRTDIDTLLLLNR